MNQNKHPNTQRSFPFFRKRGSGARARRGSLWLGRLVAFAVLVVWPLVLVGFFISSCTEEGREWLEEPLMRQLIAEPEKIPSYDFHGLLIPGTQEDAKRQGFTECSANDAFFYCARPHMGKLFGVQAHSASLILDEMDNFIETRYSIQKKNPGVFSYRSIQVEFGRTFYDADCLNNRHKNTPGRVWERSLECRKNDGIDYFRHLLQADGWVIDHSGRGRVDAYYKLGVPLEIEIGTVNGTAHIRPFPLKDVESIVQPPPASEEPGHKRSTSEDDFAHSFVRPMKQE